MVLDRKATVDKACGLIAKAAGEGAELALLPGELRARLPRLGLADARRGTPR